MSTNPLETSSGFSDRNQIKSHNLKHDKNVMLGKGNVTFYEVLEVDRIMEILFSWSYVSCKYFRNIHNRFMKNGEYLNLTMLM